jgi:hypothetical protein
MVMIKKGDPIENGEFCLVRVDGQLMLGHIFQLDPEHIRVGQHPGHVYRTKDVEIVGPVVSGDCKFIPLGKRETDAALAMLNSVASLPSADDEDWPDVIGS